MTIGRNSRGKKEKEGERERVCDKISYTRRMEMVDSFSRMNSINHELSGVEWSGVEWSGVEWINAFI